MVRIGTAGWAIRREHTASFPGTGSHLARYAAQFNAVEITSSFHRPHRPSTYARWARETPDGFAFSVKMPRAITHRAKLTNAGAALTEFLEQCGALEDKLGCVLIQLPPSLAFTTSAADFFEVFRSIHDGPAAVEPRHKSWFTPEVDTQLMSHRIARVAAVSPIGPFSPGGWHCFEKRRQHGNP